MRLEQRGYPHWFGLISVKEAKPLLDFRVETFLTVCQTMNFTRAAELLHITQPAVSQHIRALEGVYGVRFFDFHGKKPVLTRAGREFWQAAATIQHDLQHLKEQMNPHAVDGRRLAFGATLTVGEFAITAPLAAYIKKNPEVSVHMEVADTQALLKMLDDGKLDFAVVEGYFPQSAYDSLVYSTERFVAVCGRDYEFTRPVRRIEDLLGERLLVREEGSGTRRILETYLEGRNLSITDFSSHIQASNIAVIKSLTAAGCGITFLYEAAVRRELQQGEIRLIPMVDFHLVHDFSFIWRKNSLYADRYKEIFLQWKAARSVR